jgi:sigma-B regulation protein RsbU (phosphoserine phosphatase)
VDLFARVYPALQVSGDFYDYFLDETGRLTFAVADVCGKGMPAALFTTMCLTLLRHLAPGSSSPAAILQKLNAALARDNPGMMYVTMVLGKFDPATGQVVVAYGGHPLGTRLRPDGTIEPFGGDTGALLGCGELPRPIADVTTTLAPGEALLFYTDGVTEAVGGDNGSEMFGSARFEKLIQELRHEDPLDLWARSIHASVTAFGRGRPLIDDVTLLMVRRPR